MSIDWSVGVVCRFFCFKYGFEGTMPSAIGITRRIRMASHSIVAIPTRIPMDNRLFLSSPVFIHIEAHFSDPFICI